ncbi:VPLPA-CTERM sorting domain-containing protein [Sneathiella sp. HT1-7]|uniref:VPLPA-CTERM sorting domain-containing protein n=1 Tax=Sneathiella sp. HT1-7 TaxID=2887192 RepID=UPI001D13AD7F|nr:VPLPA-CTERM sorting domain-containing protein [Sneathiella sp. HT1-7]MCC3303800.1 VPLPA-CTERM sorting domain-containing protein [Sneathiella sp. HT1-7]
MIKLFKTFLAVAALSGFFALPAQSAVVSWTTDLPAADTGVPSPTTSVGTVYENLTTSVANQYRSPWQGTALDGVGTYTSVQKGSYASYMFDTGFYAIDFMWGSVDGYNGLEFYYQGNWVDALHGDDAQLSSVSNGLGFIVASIMATGVFDEVRFTSGSNAFEYANMTVSAVPLPAALPLYGAGLAVLGFFGWRKRRKSAALVA